MDIVSKITGNSLTANEFNQIPEELEQIIADSGQTPSNGDLTQVSKGITNLVGNADFYTDSGTANAKVLAVISPNQSPTSYRTGMKVRFGVNVTNTGSCTINIATLGNKAIKSYDGAALTGGEFITGVTVEAYYNGTDFLLLNTPTDVRANNNLIYNAEFEEGITGQTPIRWYADGVLSTSEFLGGERSLRLDPTDIIISKPIPYNRLDTYNLYAAILGLGTSGSYSIGVRGYADEDFTDVDFDNDAASPINLSYLMTGAGDGKPTEWTNSRAGTFNSDDWSWTSPYDSGDLDLVKYIRVFIRNDGGGSTIFVDNAKLFVTPASVTYTVKKIGTTASSEGAVSSIAHNLDASKIIGVDVLVRTGTYTAIAAGYAIAADYNFSYELSATHIIVGNTAGDSANILSKPFTVLINYER